MDKYVAFVHSDGTWEPIWLNGEQSVQREAREMLGVSIIKSDKVFAPTFPVSGEKTLNQAWACTRYGDTAVSSELNPLLTKFCDKKVHGDGVIIFVDDEGLELEALNRFMRDIEKAADDILISSDDVLNVITAYRDNSRIIYVAKNEQNSEYRAKKHDGVLVDTQSHFRFLKPIFTNLDLLLSGSVSISPWSQKRTVYIFETPLPFLVRNAMIEFGEQDRIYFLRDIPFDFPDDELGEAMSGMRKEFLENPEKELKIWLFDEE